MNINNNSLQTSTNIVPPSQQETFSASNWKTGNTGITKSIDYNLNFKMSYRVVYLDKRLQTSNTILVQNASKNLVIQGGQDVAMGTPHSGGDPDPAMSSSLQNKLTVFSNLLSIQAARKDSDSLNIGYDCEY